MPPAAETSLRRTALYERHADAGAKLVPFAGWEMPIQYAGIREERLHRLEIPSCPKGTGFHIEGRFVRRLQRKYVVNHG